MAKKESEKVKTPTEQSKPSLPLYGIFGILMLFVSVSIAYSTYIVVMGVEGQVPKLMVAPQAFFAALIAIVMFYKK